MGKKNRGLNYLIFMISKQAFLQNINQYVYCTLQKPPGQLCHHFCQRVTTSTMQRQQNSRHGVGTFVRMSCCWVRRLKYVENCRYSPCRAHTPKQVSHLPSHKSRLLTPKSQTRLPFHAFPFRLISLNSPYPSLRETPL